MSDPSTAAEYRQPDGTIIWVDPADVRAAELDKGNRTMRGTSRGKITDDRLTVCHRTGVYDFPNGRFRYVAGDKMPKGGKLAENGDAPAMSAKAKLAAKASRIQREATKRVRKSPAPAFQGEPGGELQQPGT